MLKGIFLDGLGRGKIKSSSSINSICFGIFWEKGWDREILLTLNRPLIKFKPKKINRIRVTQLERNLILISWDLNSHYNKIFLKSSQLQFLYNNLLQCSHQIQFPQKKILELNMKIDTLNYFQFSTNSINWKIHNKNK